MPSIPLRSALVTLAAVLTLTVAGPARSAPASGSALDARAAQLAAYRSLADHVLTLEVGDDTTVRGLVGRSDRVAAGLNTFIKRGRLGAPFPHGDRLAVEAAVSRTALARTLLELGVADARHAARLLDGGPERIVAIGVAKRSDHHAPAVGIPSASAPTPAASLRITATPAPEPPTAQPAPRPIPGAFRRYADDPIRPVITPDPAGAVDRRLRARRAAEVDALRRLAEQTGEVRIDTRSTTRHGDLTADTTHVHVETTLPGVRFGPTQDRADGTVAVDAAATLGRSSAPLTATGTGRVPTEARP